MPPLALNSRRWIVMFSFFLRKPWASLTYSIGGLNGENTAMNSLENV